MAKDYIYDAIVRSIYDSDSIRVDIDLGFNHWIVNEPIRLYGIDGPEIRGEERPQGLISKEWLERKIPVGSKIVIQSHKDKSGKYGRYLGTIYLDGVVMTTSLDGVNINESLVEEGLAKPYFP